MQKKLLTEADGYIAHKRRRQAWKKVVSVLACIVVFCTTYALILPAITLETGKNLVCSQETLGVHVHTDGCFDDAGEAVCGYADFVVHTHDSSCYDATENLRCPLPEIKTHVHVESCYAVPETEAATVHIHTDACYATEQGELLCTEAAHTHRDACYQETESLICDIPESDSHQHSPECFETTQMLVCPLPEEVHQHADECYGQNKVLTCKLPTELAEKSEPELICGKEEIVLHQHTAGCWDESGMLTCGKREVLEHVHSDICFQTVGAPEEIVQREGTTSDDLSAAPAANSEPTAVDLKAYLDEKQGSFSFTLVDQNNQPLPKDENGNYIVSPGTGYQLALHITSPGGFIPETYQYQLPKGLTVKSGSGSFVVDGTEIGTWTVAENGLMTFHFNENANHKSNVTITANMGVAFQEGEGPIDFDGKITVVVTKPQEEEKDTKLNKWGHQGKTEEEEDPTKIYWTIAILGNENSQIPGSTITDALTSGNHTYTESDKNAGLTFQASQKDPVTGEEIGWHVWPVSQDDPNLTWTDTEWTYTIPQTVTCKYCGNLTLGNDNWHYYVKYTSTPDPTDIVGSLTYKNHVTVDGQQADGSASVKHGTSAANVVKNGVFQGDADGGKFVWTVHATVPGMKEAEKAVYFWYLWDTMRVKDATGETIGYIDNDMNLSSVQVSYDSQTFDVPKLADATAEDLFAWDNAWSSDHKDGIWYGREIDLLCRCQCTEDNCQVWKGEDCDEKKGDGFCQCWTIEQDAVFTFTYETTNPQVIEKYGGAGNRLQNVVELSHKVQSGTSNKWEDVPVSKAEDYVPIPGIFKKELTKDYDGYVANYKITVNEAKLDLTGGEPLTIRDKMSETLVYSSGSLVITAEDVEGNSETLQEGADYKVTYDGSGTQTDTSGKPVHVLEIQLLHPGPMMYTLNYDAVLAIPEGTTEGVPYSNSASVELWGKTFISDAEDKIWTNINISAESYQITLQKIAADTKEQLPGAEFGLFNQNGNQVDSGTTDENGKLLFQTDITKGVILREHTPYYIQELKAPVGYRLDDTEQWFWFCKAQDSGCTTCQELSKQYCTGKRISAAGQSASENVLTIMNEKFHGHELPETGGSGTTLYTWGGLLLCGGAYLLYKHTKRRREGVPS